MLGQRPDRSPLGVQFKISDEHPHSFHMRSPPGVRVLVIQLWETDTQDNDFLFLFPKFGTVL